MNPDRAGRIPPPTRRLVVRKANSHRDLRPITERVSFHVIFISLVNKLSCDKHVLFSITAVFCLLPTVVRGLTKPWLLQDYPKSFLFDFYFPTGNARESVRADSIQKCQPCLRSGVRFGGVSGWVSDFVLNFMLAQNFIWSPGMVWVLNNTIKVI